MKGFPEAINSVFPKAEIQLCVISQIRNILKYVASKDQKKFMIKLREVYKTPTEEAGLINLDTLEGNLVKKYSLAIGSWKITGII